MPPLLSNKVIVVSGAGPGLGRAIAGACLEHGARSVVLGARKTDPLAALTHDLEAIVASDPAMGGVVMGLPVDITEASSCAAFVEAVVDRFGHIDCLFNNAHRGSTSRSLTEVDPDEWRQVFDVNIVGTLTMAQAALAGLERSDSPRIVNVTSMAARQSDPATGAYGASKAALGWVTRSLAAELGPRGIRVNALQPGWMQGPAVERSLASMAAARDLSPADVRAELEGRMALREMPTDDDVAGTAVFLASDLAAPITGQIIDVNAGHWM